MTLHDHSYKPGTPMNLGREAAGGEVREVAEADAHAGALAGVAQGSRKDDAPVGGVNCVGRKRRPWDGLG